MYLRRWGRGAELFVDGVHLNAFLNGHLKTF